MATFRVSFKEDREDTVVEADDMEIKDGIFVLQRYRDDGSQMYRTVFMAPWDTVAEVCDLDDD